MGEWNATCQLSRLPVLPGDDIKMILSAPRGLDYMKTTSCDGCWAPVSLPLAGEYGGYGNISCLDENDPVNRSAMELLKNTDFRERTGDGGAVPVDLDGLDGPDPEETLTALLDAAWRGNLDVFASDAGEPGSWRPVSVHAFRRDFYDYAVESMKKSSSDPRWLGSTGFRLRFLGPLRASFRRLDPVWGDGNDPGDPPVSPLGAAMELSALLSAMDALRAAFGPCSGAGGQDCMREDWTREFYLRAWLEAEALPWRFEEEPLPELSAAMAWDGNGLHTDRNGLPADYPDVPEDRTLVRPAVLEAGVRNVLAAIRAADKKKGPRA